MSTNLSNANATVPRSKKVAGLLWCAGVGIGFHLIGKVLHWLFASYNVMPFDQPLSIPDEWWSVDLRMTNLAVRELLGVALFVAFLRLRGLRFLDLGFKNPGTKMTWLVALLVLALGLLSHPFVRNGPYPLTGYTIYAALMIGIPVALNEESIYRGFAVSTLQAAGFGLPVQILFSGFIFGLVHISSYIQIDWSVPVFTGVLGCIWSWIYVVSRNSLWPTMIAHVVNDAVIMPYFYLHKVY